MKFEILHRYDSGANCFMAFQSICSTVIISHVLWNYTYLVTYMLLVVYSQESNRWHTGTEMKNLINLIPICGVQLRIILKLKPSSSVGHLCNVQQVNLILKLSHYGFTSSPYTETDGYVGVFQVCYHVLGLVHAMWPPLPQTVRCILLVLFHVLLIGIGKRT